MDHYHQWQKLQSQVVKWFGTDKQLTFEKHIAEAKSRALLEEHGWLYRRGKHGRLDPTCISYSFNTEGFRDDEFNDEPAGMALGCSFTKGVGVDFDNTWPKKLSTMLNMRVWNLGVGGSASDTAYRLAEHWLDRLNIKFVAMLVPNVDRVEIWEHDSPHVLTHNSDTMPNLNEYKKVYLANSKNGHINQKKNLLAIQYLCAQKQIPFYHLFKDRIHLVDYGRDLGHWGRKSNARLAEKMYNLIKGIE